jgi:membrane-bound lytic murein transglycosylase D
MGLERVSFTGLLLRDATQARRQGQVSSVDQNSARRLVKYALRKALAPTSALALAALTSAGCGAPQGAAVAAKPPQQATAPASKPAAGQAANRTASQEANASAANGGQSSSGPGAFSANSTLAGAPATPQEQALIDAVDQDYRNGLAHYRAGEPQAAKADFDHAVDSMLTSQFDLKNDAVLSAEFDRVVDGVNALEMEALKQGTGFSPKTEPSPVDIANDVTFPVDPTIKAEAIAELKTTQSDLPLVINDPVASYINYFSSRGRGTLTRSLERANQYHAMISRVLKQAGLPQDLIYQAVAESGFQPRAVNSRYGAGGMWQFLPDGPYGLNRTSWVDERFDPEKSTEAYARYIKELYAQFGDWYLAMAAYDWGAGKVQRSVQRTGYADFWELYHRGVLPKETKNYVPIIIAAAIMAKNPKQYGLDSLTPDPELVTDTVVTDSSIDLHLVADCVGSTVQEIADLNPSLLRLSTPPDASFDLHLPVGTKDLFEKRIAEIPPDKRGSWRFHLVAPGESLASIARDYHLTPAEIAFVNQIQPDDDLSGTDSLVIPVAPAPTWRTASRSTAYRVERGDTLVTIADRFDVTVQQLRRWNRLRSNSVTPGRTLYVSEPAHVSHSSRSKSSHSPSSGKKSKSPARASSSSEAHAATLNK